MYVTKSIKRIRMQRDRKVALLTYCTFRLLGVGIVVSKGFLCVIELILPTSDVRCMI